jgi:glycine cleavage system H lipoate-binding protein
LLLDEIQDRCPGVEVIGIRGDQSLEDALAAVKSGVSELLARPLSPVAVRSAVLQALERREWLIRADRPPARGDGAEPCWLEYEGDGQVAVGAERAFVEAIGDPVYVELPVDGQRIARGGTLLRVLTRDSRIHVVDCPVTGVVLRCNEALVRDADEIRQGVWAVRLSVERQGRLRQSGGAV